MKLTLPEVIQRLTDLQAGAWPNQPTNVVDVHAGAMGVEVTTGEDETVASLRHDLREAEDEIGDLEMKVNRLDIKVDGLESDLKRAEAENESKAREIAELEDEIARLRAERT